MNEKRYRVGGMTLELRNVTKRVGAETQLHETSLVLADRSFNILLGPTLAGKTSMMQLMAGLVRPSSGEVWFEGKNVTGVAVQKRNIAMVYQQFINYPNFTVYENIASPLRVAGMPAREIEARVKSTADLLRLGPMLQRKPNELSGGQQQRTAIARALAKDSDLILLDEPLANLDYKLREELRDELPRLFAGRNSIVVYATTEPIEALLFGGNTATISEGRVTEFGPTATIYRRPSDLITATVFSDPPINTASVVKRGDEVQIGEAIRLPAGKAGRSIPDGPYVLGIRPHHISPESLNGTSGVLEGRVLVTELSGSESVVHFDLDGRTWVSQSHGIHPFAVGATARLYVDVDHSLYFGPDNRLVAGGE
jgi:glycerol transport system ATP-binding protein